MEEPVLQKLAVQVMKPVLSDAAWEWVRHLDPRTRRRDEERAQREAKRVLREAKQAAQRVAEQQRLAASDLSTQDLSTLARHFGTDKVTRHHYPPHYERHLAHLKHASFTLLEIGIGGYSRTGEGGASLRMWKHYFPHAEIIGLDIEDKSFVVEDRIRAVQGSQVDEKLLTSVARQANNLQVVIDDGSHVCAHVVETFRILFPLLADGGVYVIEDTQTSYWERYGGSSDLGDPSTSMNMVKSLLDGLNYEEHTPPDHVPTYPELHVVAVHAYHNLVFIEKGLNNESAASRAHAVAAARAAADQPGAGD